MSESVVLDKKGRLVLPKKVREQAHIDVNTRLVARVRGVGQVELFDPNILMAEAQKIGAKKLVGWKEEDHEATSLLLEVMKDKGNEID